VAQLNQAMKRFTLVLLTIFAAFVSASAQNAEPEQSGFAIFKGLEYQLKANFSIGGSAPLGLPSEIRSIESYNPTSSFGLEANATRWLSSNGRWGVRLGAKIEEKGMKTEALVKSYLVEIRYGKEMVRGYYTGMVETNVKNTYATIPVTAVYKLGDSWQLTGGFYVSATIDKLFDGYVSDGYLRQGTPVGDKITFDNGATAPYDFSSEVRDFHWGAQLGAEWHIKRHFVLFSDLSYGINGLLNSDFNSISFSMHNIYLNLGFGYRF
jgi:hypothetical protein